MVRVAFHPHVVRVAFHPHVVRVALHPCDFPLPPRGHPPDPDVAAASHSSKRVVAFRPNSPEIHCNNAKRTATLALFFLALR